MPSWLARKSWLTVTRSKDAAGLHPGIKSTDAACADDRPRLHSRFGALAHRETTATGAAIRPGSQIRDVSSRRLGISHVLRERNLVGGGSRRSCGRRCTASTCGSARSARFTCAVELRQGVGLTGFIPLDLTDFERIVAHRHSPICCVYLVGRLWLDLHPSV